jgi:hypothetical protein
MSAGATCGTGSAGVPRIGAGAIDTSVDYIRLKWQTRNLLPLLVRRSSVNELFALLLDDYFLVAEYY